MFWLLLLVIAAYWFIDWIVRIPCLPSGSIKKKFVLITGCDSGFGRVAAKMLDEKGFHVFATCMTEEGEEQLQQTCSGKLRTLRLDVRYEDSINTALEFVKRCIPEGEGLWGVVSNAGVYPTPCPPHWLVSAGYERVMKVNLYGVIDLILAFLPLVKKAQGRVVIMTSYSGKFASPDGTDYMVSKFGLEGYADSLRRGLREFGVSVHVVEPGYFSTCTAEKKQVMADAMDGAWKALPENIKKSFGGEDFLENPKGVFKDAKNWGAHQGSKRLYLVGDAYLHALTAQHPRIRYHVGIDAKLFYYPMEWLPDWLVDIVFREGVGFARSHLISLGDWLASLLHSNNVKKQQ